MDLRIVCNKQDIWFSFHFFERKVEDQEGLRMTMCLLWNCKKKKQFINAKLNATWEIYGQTFFSFRCSYKVLFACFFACVRVRGVYPLSYSIYLILLWYNLLLTTVTCFLPRANLHWLLLLLLFLLLCLTKYRQSPHCIGNDSFLFTRHCIFFPPLL